MNRTLLSLVLAKLLIQFREPVIFQNIDTNETVIANSSDHRENDTSFASADNVGLSQLFHYMWNDTFSLATMLVTMSFISLLISHHTFLGSHLLGVRLRASCRSLLYRKVFWIKRFILNSITKIVLLFQSIRLSASAASQTGTGHVVNLMSNDASRLLRAVLFMHYIWILPIQSITVAYLIFKQSGWVGIGAVIFLLLTTVPVQTYLGRYKVILRKKVASRTDKRIGIVNEIVQGIQVIKMYVWEIPFQTIVAESRRLEIQQIRYVSYANGISLGAYYFVGRSTIFISILILFLSGQTISAEIVFPMAQCFAILQVKILNSKIFKN